MKKYYGKGGIAPCILDIGAMLRIGFVTGFCERGNEHSSSIRGGEFLDQLNKYNFNDN
jgi:hypothetical protein